MLNMKSCSWLAVGVVSLAFSTVSLGADKFKLPDCSNADALFNSLSAEEQDQIYARSKTLMLDEIYRFALGKDSIIAYYYKARKESDFNTDLLKIRELAKISSIHGQIESDYEKNKVEYDAIGNPGNLSKKVITVEICSIGKLANSTSDSIGMLASNYLKSLAALEDSATGVAGYFEITVNGCAAYKALNTGNPYSNPTPDSDSRFLVVDATFKNIDHEGRLPFAGSLVIVKGGTEYTYDTTETILAEGYGMKSINPLIKLRTKIVYRVPNEMDGDVYWKPGRNPDSVKLWCTHLSAASS